MRGKAQYSLDIMPHYVRFYRRGMKMAGHGKNSVNFEAETQHAPLLRILRQSGFIGTSKFFATKRFL